MEIKIRAGCEDCLLGRVINLKTDSYHCLALKCISQTQKRALHWNGVKFETTMVLANCPLMANGRIIIISDWIAEDNVTVMERIDDYQRNHIFPK